MLVPGIYDRLLDEELADLLASHPELVAPLEKLDDELAPQAYSQFVGQLLRAVLPNAKPQARFDLVNRLVELIGAEDGLDYVRRRKLIADAKTVLRQVRSKQQVDPFREPETPISVSSLLTGAAQDPQLDRELRAEMLTADRVDILVSFIKWTGLSLLLPAFEDLESRAVPVRIITTSYMGASDPRAVEWLAARKNVQVKVSYDTERTRLHAKAYHFVRHSGFSTAYIGSANMSRPAMTSGLEWTVKVTAQDLPHILERFEAEFETYWRQPDFTLFDPSRPERFREAIAHFRSVSDAETPRFFADIKPHPFQERVLEALDAARMAGSFKNLVVAATGTGKTVMAAFDFARFQKKYPDASRLLFVAHRKEILLQARDCFRAVLRDFNFGELLVDGSRPTRWDHVFASVQSLSGNRIWESLGAEHHQYLVIDEAHHGTAASYRPLFEELRPIIRLGLSATPERMDGSSILPDFDNQFAAEIRLPEALEEKLLCPFHYFGVTDPVSTADDSFWRNGKYDTELLEQVYTGDHINALNRLNAVFGALRRYQPDIDGTRCIGFCAGVRHAEFMASKFREHGFKADFVTGATSSEERASKLADFKAGRLNFIFAVDVFSEGVDIPDINLVMFLRPTESLTVFLQQLGRGLRHAQDKECLVVLDFVGQAHRRYRLDRKFSALLRNTRRRIDTEIEADFPNLPPGCSIQLERVAKEHVLSNIRESLGNLQAFVPEAIRTFTAETGRDLSFGAFISETDLSAVELLKNKTWTEWKDAAFGTQNVQDPDLEDARKALCKLATRTDIEFLRKAREVSVSKIAEAPENYGLSEREAAALHYLFWSKDGRAMSVSTYRDSFAKWIRNKTAAADLAEIVDWRTGVRPYPIKAIDLPYPCHLKLHASYGLREITAAFGKASLSTTGPAGTGVIHIETQRTYLHLITFKKEDRDFAPTTRYKDYPISPDILHWETQSGTTQASSTGQNHIYAQGRGYTILFFARLEKRIDGKNAPYVYLGPAERLMSYEGERPIKMVWKLKYAIPAEMYEVARTV
jgi:superfamily II DNA or RNA helicase/HKD family nuclease